MSVLSIEHYNQQEESARIRHPNRIVEAFSPVIFEKLSYPHRIRQEEELWKFLDVMHENEYLSNRDRSAKLLTAREFELFKKVALLIQGYAEKELGKKAIPWNTLIGTMELFRYAQILLSKVPKSRILEIGPGCGYMGLLLMLFGHPYVGTDISQAFYLFQNRMFKHFFADSFQDLAQSNLSLSDAISATQGPLRMHLPWWKYVEMWPEKIPEFDVVVADRMLCEMHPNSLVFLLKTAQMFFRGEGELKGILFRGWGYSGEVPVLRIVETFYKCGYVAAILHSNLTFFIPEGCREQGHFYLEYPQVVELFKGNGVLPIERMEGSIFHHFLQGNQAVNSEISVSLQDITDFVAQQLGGQENIQSKDSQFLDYVLHGGCVY
ncbi:MAG: hypothetical protein HQL75_10460 [Magnetococcales bacterium]|nr:hypothetical protein [Magnetococcales bacterium]